MTLKSRTHVYTSGSVTLTAVNTMFRNCNVTTICRRSDEKKKKVAIFPLAAVDARIKSIDTLKFVLYLLLYLSKILRFFLMPRLVECNEQPVKEGTVYMIYERNIRSLINIDKKTKHNVRVRQHAIAKT